MCSDIQMFSTEFVGNKVDGITTNAEAIVSYRLAFLSKIPGNVCWYLVNICFYCENGGTICVVAECHC